MNIPRVNSGAHWYQMVLGVWGNGKWDRQLCNTLIVTGIDDRGGAFVIYSWGTWQKYGISPGYKRVYARITDDGALELYLGGADVRYTFDGNKLRGTYTKRGEVSRVTLSREGSSEQGNEETQTQQSTKPDK